MTTATGMQRQALIEAFGESSGSESEAHPQRRALAEVSGESLDSDGEVMSLGSDGKALSSDSENEALGESSDMENQSLEESSDSENEAVGESSDSKDEIEARTEAQGFAILDAFGESPDSENEALGESSKMENQSLEESSDSKDEIEARTEAQRLAILEAFGESSDSEDEIEAHPSSCCDAESKRRALLEAFGESSDSENETLGAKARRFPLVQAFGETSDSEEEISSSDQIMELGEEAASHRWEMVEGIKGLWLCRDFLSAKHQFLLMQAIQREGWFEGSGNNQGMRFGDLPEWATELSRSIWEAVCFAEVVGEETTEDSCMEGACPLPVDILLRVPLFDQLIINVYQPGNMCSCGPDAF